MINRRKFIKQSALTTGSVLTASSLIQAADLLEPVVRLTILHTNDTHSRIDPFPADAGRNAGLGGVAQRSFLIDSIRRQEEHVLLLDAGDIFQGTPYFNVYKGEPEIKAMAAMQYDAATIGNHDFDAGLENLAAQLHGHANFPMIICNYDFKGTAMEDLYVPYKIFNKGGIKIGVLGVGIELDGLVPQNLYGKTKYLGAIQQANETAYKLKQQHCDLIICLSHLGYSYTDGRLSDIMLAKETENIDLIIGGHTHTFLDAPVVVKNKRNEEVVINQVGWAGIRLGRLSYEFKRGKKKSFLPSDVITVTKNFG